MNDIIKIGISGNALGSGGYSNLINVGFDDVAVNRQVSFKGQTDTEYSIEVQQDANEAVFVLVANPLTVYSAGASRGGALCIFLSIPAGTYFREEFTPLTLLIHILNLFRKENMIQKVNVWEYQFKAYYGKDNRCKQYVYNYDIEQQIKEYCKDNNINKYQIINITIVNKFADDKISFEQTEVRFSSKLHLLKPDNWSCTEFENYLMSCLYINYPQLRHYQELADNINRTFYADDYDRQISFKPKFTWNKGNKAVTKIGIRATNSLVSAKKEQDENKLCKEDVLNRYGLKYEFDVKSSVPRLTFALNKGVWLENDIDLYEIMYQKFIKLCPSEQLEWNETTRNIFKSFHMNGYFDTEAKLSAHLKRQVSMKVEKYNKKEWADLEYVMKSYRESIIETVGELKYDSEIFFHESCIYMDVTYDLLSKGIDVWQQYDCWYTDKEVANIEQIVEHYVSRYIVCYI